MTFKNYLPPGDLPERLKGLRRDYAEKFPDRNHSEFMTALAEREARLPGGYLAFGPYWWALKAVLLERGYDFSSEVDGILAAVYCGRDEAGAVDGDLTIVAAFHFREIYDATFFAGTNQFDLSGEGLYYVLEDTGLEYGDEALI